MWDERHREREQKGIKKRNNEHILMKMKKRETFIVRFKLKHVRKFSFLEGISVFFFI